MASNTYVPPGVTITEIPTPATNTLSLSSGTLCIVGPPSISAQQLACNPITTTDVVILNGTNPVVPPTIAAINNNAQLVEVLAVLDVLNPNVGNPPGTGYPLSDFTITTGSNGTIAWASDANIPSTGEPVLSITYTYLPFDYWNPVLMTDIGSVQARFGPAWQTAVSASGQTVDIGINSPLSMAATIAFQNGVSSVLCCPLFSYETPGNPLTPQVAANVTQIGVAQTWSDTLYNMRNIEGISALVPVVGQTYSPQNPSGINDEDMLNIFYEVQAYQYYMNSLSQNIIAFFGEDGTTEGIGSVGINGAATGLIATLRQHAAALQASYFNSLSSQDVLVNATVLQLAVPGLNTTINVGGQYAAVAVAAAMVSRPPSQSLTRQAIAGFAGMTDPRFPSDRNTDAAAGLMVLEAKNNTIICRHAITLDIANGTPYSELSVVYSKYSMVQNILNVLNDNIIGQVFATTQAPTLIESVVESVLSLMQSNSSILGYSNIKAQIASLNPTVATISFSFQPAFTINYLDVSFNMDLTSGSISSTPAVPNSSPTSTLL